MSTSVLPVLGPFEPDPCAAWGRAPARSTSVSAVIIVVVVGLWAGLVAAGVPPQGAVAGLAAAAGLGLRIAAWLTGRGGRRV